MALILGCGAVRRGLGIGVWKTVRDAPTQAVAQALQSGEDVTGHAEETGRKPRMIGDVEIDEPLHGSRNYAFSKEIATAARADWVPPMCG